jgi:DNA polymerase-1
MPTLLLVDGTALAYRAFHAIPSLTREDGFPVNALFGFARMLRQLESAWHPTHWAVVFDAGTPEHRLRLLPSYKAQRTETPAGLQAQWPVINEYLAAASVPVLQQPGEEADDVMATAARWAERSLSDVLLATSDKDMGQLVTARVGVIPLTKSDQRQGVAETEAKVGVRPDQIVDWLALTGDAVDNIPGVPGVGPKTATALLQKFGSLAALYDRLAEVQPERIRKALDEHRAAALRNVILTRLRDDLPIALDWPGLAVRKPDWAVLVAFLERMGLKSLAREARDAANSLF